MDRRFICVLKRSRLYDLDYVRVMQHSLTSLYGRSGYTLMCLSDVTDIPDDLRDVHFIRLAKQYPGRWSKLELFREDIIEHCYPALFVDLDTALLFNMDSMLRKLQELDQFVMLRDLYKPERPASGLMWLPKRKSLKVPWIGFGERAIRDDPKADDGKYIYEKLYPDSFFQDLFPDEICSFKPGNSRGRLKTIPPGVKIVCFHGDPRPRVAADEVDWVSRWWHGYSVKYGVCKAVSSTYPHAHEGTLAIVGSAPCWKEDLETVQRMRPMCEIMVIGHAAGLVQAEFVVTDHYETFPTLFNLQSAFHGEFSTHCSRGGGWWDWTRWIDYYWDWPRSDTTSVYTGIRIAMEVGFDEIVLCGNPLEASKMLHPLQVKKDGKKWPPPGTGVNTNDSAQQLEHFRTNFEKHIPEFNDTVRSMSGWTRKMLGAL